MEKTPTSAVYVTRHLHVSRILKHIKKGHTQERNHTFVWFAAKDFHYSLIFLCMKEPTLKKIDTSAIYATKHSHIARTWNDILQHTLEENCDCKLCYKALNWKYVLPKIKVLTYAGWKPCNCSLCQKHVLVRDMLSTMHEPILEKKHTLNFCCKGLHIGLFWKIMQEPTEKA